jgi:hypothetical protein
VLNPTSSNQLSGLSTQYSRRWVPSARGTTAVLRPVATRSP